MGSKRLVTTVRGLDSSVIGHCAFLRDIFAFVYSSSVSGEYVHFFFHRCKIRFCPFLTCFEMLHFVCCMYRKSVFVSISFGVSYFSAYACCLLSCCQKSCFLISQTLRKYDLQQYIAAFFDYSFRRS